jgi:ERF superfamily
MQNAITKIEPVRPAPSAIEILDAAVRGGVTSENVAVVREIIAMRREEIAAENKAQFNRAFFNLKAELAQMNFYADKSAKTDGGAVAYKYCSEQEIASKLEPILLKHGFAMLFGQRDDNGRIVAIVTLIHNSGHEETREYSVRAGETNRMKNATAADTSATTSAWRHLVVKMFGLKSRISEDDDARNLGETNVFVTPEQADELERRVAETNSDKAAFLKFAGAAKFSEIPAANYARLDASLRRKEGGAR